MEMEVRRFHLPEDEHICPETVLRDIRILRAKLREDLGEDE